MFQENDELRIRELESIKKVEELSKLLEEATTRNHHTKDTVFLIKIENVVPISVTKIGCDNVNRPNIQC